MCIHASGIPEECCDLCNGNSNKREQEKIDRKNHSTVRLKKRLQFLTIQEAERHNIPIEDWEIDYFLNNISPEDQKYKLMYLYELALHFERTFQSMLWWDLIAWNKQYKDNVINNPEDIHCKALILRFEKRKQLMEENKIGTTEI